ncbi:MULTISPECIES: hypothetical protein [Bradyrhizobium]|uniref:Uncharacterized protein n=1 Tax=Bradyrhizobium elkanii TaxID=29448 RepID=A0A7Y8QYA0_BRAEL|nr:MULTISPECIES: hypothetical protein [Bradyrhizobium]MBP1294548.1 hypothetical protein [Bradyrhizobium elkanii]MBP2432664.1 hypothetical protein [Bradyrhizobium elkanii]MCP1734020.1 hypothetical protein [Bradyrhizobium elkanii]MCP1751703.1 hypothetical protein [Bradyrhizobium elkanii]MCP1925069.1 hypothetical protein [Bradyrhizobium elkanii]
MDRVQHLAPADTERGIAGLVSSLADAKRLAAMLQHLGHEGHFLQAAVGIQRREDLLLASDLHQVTSAKDT